MSYISSLIFVSKYLNIQLFYAFIYLYYSKLKTEYSEKMKMKNSLLQSSKEVKKKKLFKISINLLISFI